MFLRLILSNDAAKKNETALLIKIITSAICNSKHSFFPLPQKFWSSCGF